MQDIFQSVDYLQWSKVIELLAPHCDPKLGSPLSKFIKGARHGKHHHIISLISSVQLERKSHHWIKQKRLKGDFSEQVESGE